MHNWVCWAAPVHDPVTGEQLGVIDLSTTWDRTHPIGLATARVMARLIETAMPQSRAYAEASPMARARLEPGLDLTLLGTAEARLDGQRLLLNRRQTEILALLALHPAGLSLEQLHALLYGDQLGHASPPSRPRSPTSVQRTRRPARLAPLPADDAGHHRRQRGAPAAAQRRRCVAAVAAYGGDLMPGTESPALIELADYVAVAVREALLADPQPQAVASLHRARAVRHRGDRGGLTALGPRAHPAKALLKGRLAAAR